MDSPYTALARRFRPQTFTEVIGQDRVATTLRNAILEGRVAHAYLFTGARGVGKTSMARIFAKALNCPNAVDAVPCNTCEICRGIAAGQDVDVSEIDGASNRGIDDIRTLRANVNVRSMRSKYKVYIVDEVHMLTKEAFNALLKTLEEPPPGVKFIFCTTEPNKVPDTILSRCQRFDFGVIATDAIKGRLRELATAEGFEVDEEALEIVARRAAGSMRDSQSLFDQLLAFGSQHITAADVHRLLGTAPDERLIALVQAVIDRQRDSVLDQLQQALDRGVQLEPFFDQLIAYVRDLMVCAASAGDVPLMSVGRDRRAALHAQAGTWGLQTIVAALEILSEAKLRMQRSTFGRALAELALVRLSLMRDLDRLDALIADLKAGHAVPSGGPLPPARSAPPSAKPSIVGAGSLARPEAGSPEKKNDIESVGEDTAPPSISQSAKNGEPSAAERPSGAESAKSWRTGAELLEELQTRFSDITGTYLRQVHSSAISGPNQLELTFPAGYDMGQRACERPEVLTQLESALTEIAGQPMRLRFRVAPGTAKPVAQATTAPTPARRAVTVEDPTDPLVAEVGRVFGVDLWRMQEMGRIATETTSDADSSTET